MKNQFKKHEKRLRTNDTERRMLNEIGSSNNHQKLSPKPAIIDLKCYTDITKELTEISNAESIMHDMSHDSIVNCANCGVWYNPGSNELEVLVTPLSIQINNIHETISYITTQNDSNAYYEYRHFSLSEIANIYDSYITNSLVSYFASFVDVFIKQNDVIRTALSSSIILGNGARITSDFIYSYINILYDKNIDSKSKMDKIHIAIQIAKDNYMYSLSTNLNSMITGICYGYFKNRYSEDCKSTNEDAKTIIDAISMVTGVDIIDNAELFECLQKIFVGPFNNCAPIIEVLLWQLLKTIDYLNVNDFFRPTIIDNDEDDKFIW